MLGGLVVSVLEFALELPLVLDLELELDLELGWVGLGWNAGAGLVRVGVRRVGDGLDVRCRFVLGLGLGRPLA